MPQRFSPPIFALTASPVRNPQAASTIETLRHIDGRETSVVVFIVAVLTMLRVRGLLLLLELHFLSSLSLCYSYGLLMVWLRRD